MNKPDSGAIYGWLGALIVASRVHGRMLEADDGPAASWAFNQVERIQKDLIDQIETLFREARERAK